MISPAGRAVTSQAWFDKRRRRVVAVAVIAIAIAGASAATASGLISFRDPTPNDPAFPNQITCTQGTSSCSPGRSAGGQVFTLFQVGESGVNAQVVGAGVDTGNGVEVTPLVCTHSGGGIECGTQPAGGEKQLGLYLPG